MGNGPSLLWKGELFMRSRTFNDDKDGIRYNACLREIFESEATLVDIDRPLEKADDELLRDVLITSQRVIFNSIHQDCVRILCDALAHPDCMIVELDIRGESLYGERVQLDMLLTAFRSNRSLRRVEFKTGGIGLAVVASTTVEELVASQYVLIPPEQWEALFKMPSLRSCADHAEQAFPDSERVKLWPHGVRARNRTYKRSPNEVFHVDLQLRRAAYECAARILPECVVNDLDDEIARIQLRERMERHW